MLTRADLLRRLPGSLGSIQLVGQPGSGKTSSLAAVLEALIVQHNTPPNQILLLTGSPHQIAATDLKLQQAGLPLDALTELRPLRAAALGQLVLTGDWSRHGRRQNIIADERLITDHLREHASAALARIAEGSPARTVSQLLWSFRRVQDLGLTAGQMEQACSFTESPAECQLCMAAAQMFRKYCEQPDRNLSEREQVSELQRWRVCELFAAGGPGVAVASW